MTATAIAAARPGDAPAWSDSGGHDSQDSEDVAQAFSAIFETYQQPIYLYVLRMMGGAVEDARDLTQETFIKAFTALPKMPPDLKTKPWLYRIATNVCIDTLRRKRLIAWQRWDRFLTMFHPAQMATDNPERDALHQEEREEVQQVLAQLTPKHRLCLTLREYRGLSYAEIAQVLHTTPNTIKTLLYRARESFRRHYRQLHPQAA